MNEVGLETIEESSLEKLLDPGIGHDDKSEDEESGITMLIDRPKRGATASSAASERPEKEEKDEEAVGLLSDAPDSNV